MSGDAGTFDVVVIGGAGVDSTVYVPMLPLPYAETYTVPPVIDRIGNTGAGVSLGCAALGLRVHFADLIGDDPQGALIRRAMSGISCGFGHAAAGTRRSVLLVDPSGRRSALFDPRATPGERLSPDLYRHPARHVHLSITDFSRHVYPDLDGVTVSTDLHDWDGVRTYHQDFAYQSDLVFLSAAALPDPEATMRDIIVNGRATTVVCTRGADGCLALTTSTGARPLPAAPPSGPVRAFPAAPLPGPVVDTDGAGDAFVSGFLYGMLHGEPLERCIRLGAVAGAHACTTEGTHESPITEDLLLTRAGHPPAG